MAQLAFPLEEPRAALRLVAMCSDDERTVACVLQWGRGGAMQVTDIARRTGIPSRRVQELIEHLIRAHELPIGTAMRRPFGNYLIDKPQDLEETVALLRTRGISHLARAASLKRMSLKRYLAEVQLELEEDKG
jgi:hypothetical protein